MKANSDKSKQSNKATRRVLAGVLCGASVLSLVLSLVMPPISQAIANDAQTVSAEETVTAGGSSTESTDVGNTNNGDTEKLNSDEAENDASEDTVAADSTADGSEVKGAEQPAEDDTNDEDAIAPATENESDYEIRNAAELSSKLLNKELRDGDGVATFKLTADIDYNDEIRLEQSSDNLINITLNLNGHKIKQDSAGKPLFDIAKGATLTVVDDVDSGYIQENVVDGQQLQDKDEHLTPDNYGKTAKMSYDDNGIPTDLTYYVTESTASGAGTTEKIYEHTATIQGAIVGVTKNSTMRLINVYQHGTFNLVSGAITQKKGCKVGSLIYAENGSTVNMSGGYVCGATSTSRGAGIELGVQENKGATLKLTGGVIAGNCAPSGGGVYANGAAVTVTGGIISGNSTLDVGLGGGIMAEGGIVTVSGGYITNNRMVKFCNTEGSGCHGGAGLAAHKGAHVTISDGQITGNYSDEAGGGVYVTDQGRDDSRKDTAWLKITGGIIASNVSFRSEGAGIRVGQKVDAMIGDTLDNNGTPGSKVYITNNRCMSRFDWGGGGVFVQGDSNTADNAGRLFVYYSYISSNTAGGYGGGVAVCPTGKTLVTNTKGTAIFGNSSAGKDQNFKEYNRADGSGNDGTPHLSGGGIADTNKTEDREAYGSPTFRESGHADFFLAARDHATPVAVVTGKMLGGGDAQYSGSIELKEAITIPANGAVGVKNSIGLTSGVEATDKAATDAQDNATTFITGNYSWDHGGGIMSNGDLYLGQPTDAYVYPSLKATKELIDSQTGKKKPLTKNEFTFKVYRKDSKDPFANGTFDRGVCTEVGNAGNDANGNITFNLGDQSAPSSSAGEITYYLVEDAGNDPYIKYDPAVYEIVGTLKDNVTELMSVPTPNDKYELKPLSVHNYTLINTSVTKYSGGSTKSLGTLHDDGQGYYSIVNSDGSKTFTNTYTSYTSSGSWKPQVTKEVDGGEMKKFKFELANDENFTNPETVTVDPSKATTDENGNETVPVKFETKDYELKDLENGSKTFTYYVREENESSTYPHYKFDQSVYRFNVVATDNTKGGIDCAVTYRKGYVNSEGKWINDDTTDHDLTDTPTFTNTYSTSLPLSGMSGVTLTYLAGAAVLCAAAAWMHIRRKANVKGGERRE
jgi:hypothetical protein